MLANSVHWYGHVLGRENGHVLRREDGHILRTDNDHVLRREDGHILRRENGHVLRRALDFEVAGQRKKGKPKRKWKKQVDVESVKVGLSRKDALCPSKWSVVANLISNMLM